MPRRWPANSACRSVLVPARPGITNALGCVVADLRHDFVNTRQPAGAAARRGARATRSSSAQTAEGEALIAKEAVEPDDDPRRPFRRHAVRRPDAHPQRAAAVGRGRRATVAGAVREGLFRPLQGRAAGNPRQLVNLNTSVIGVRPPVDLSRLIDPAGRAATLDDALQREAARLVRRRLARNAGL